MIWIRVTTARHMDLGGDRPVTVVELSFLQVTVVEDTGDFFRVFSCG